MSLSRAVPLALLLVAAGCYHTEILRLNNEPRRATHPDSVRLLGQEPAQPYIVIAILAVSSGGRNLDEIRLRLLKEAARLGGEAVLFETGSVTTIPTGSGEYTGTGRQLSAKVIVFNRQQRAANTQ
jgi:hypothetical protein